MKRREIVVALMIALVSRVAAGQTIRGTIVDSASGKGVARARVSVSGTSLQATADSLGRFTITGAPSGEQLLAIHTPSLDSLNAGYSAQVTVAGGMTAVAVRVPSALQIAAGACGSRDSGAGGILLGRLRVDGDSTAPLSGTVSAEWGARQASAGAAPGDSRWVSATADTRGRFALCGVPLDTALTLKALTDRASGQAGNVRVPTSARFARTEIVLRKEVATTGILAGIVTDSANVPLGGVEVSLPDLSKNTLTNEQGAFALRDVPPGAQRLVVRRFGYGPIEAPVAIEAGRTIERHIRMLRATSLDSVVVTEKAVDHQLDDFEVNKKLGLGHFLTRAELAPQEGRSTGAVLTTMPGIKVFAIGPYAWVGSGRHNATSIGSGALLDPMDSAKRAPLWDCYALVYLDNHVVFRGQKLGHPPRWEPLFDINSIPVSEIEAIEYYATAAQAPMKYSGLNSQCGVVVIHTLRYHPADTTAAAKKPPQI
jgi:CarboxypepD_reg-like domain/Carboxypeptidase regulatory-like domain